MAKEDWRKSTIARDAFMPLHTLRSSTEGYREPFPRHGATGDVQKALSVLDRLDAARAST